MAVRVVDEKPDPSVVQQVICASCGVKLEYVPNDLEKVRWRDYDGSSAGVEQIRCPKCGKYVIVKSW